MGIILSKVHMEVLVSHASNIGLSSDVHIFESTEDRFEVFKEALDKVPKLKQQYLNDVHPDKKILELFNLLSKATQVLVDASSTIGQKLLHIWDFESLQNVLHLSVHCYTEVTNMLSVPPAGRDGLFPYSPAPAVTSEPRTNAR